MVLRRALNSCDNYNKHEQWSLNSFCNAVLTEIEECFAAPGMACGKIDPASRVSRSWWRVLGCHLTRRIGVAGVASTSSRRRDAATSSLVSFRFCLQPFCTSTTSTDSLLSTPYHLLQNSSLWDSIYSFAALHLTDQKTICAVCRTAGSYRSSVAILLRLTIPQHSQ